MKTKWYILKGTFCNGKVNHEVIMCGDRKTVCSVWELLCKHGISSGLALASKKVKA